MEAQIKALGGKVTIKVQGEDVKALFKELASAMEVFDAAQTCDCASLLIYGSDGRQLHFLWLKM